MDEWGELDFGDLATIQGDPECDEWGNLVDDDEVCDEPFDDYVASLTDGEIEELQGVRL